MLADHLLRPFVESTLDVLGAMAALTPEVGAPFAKTADHPLGDASGVIGLVGEHMTGGMAIVFPAPTIVRIASNMLYEKFPELNSDVMDCVGELTNIICGGVKRRFGESGIVFQLTLPSIIGGPDHAVHHMTRSVVTVIPFRIAEGEFFLEAHLTEPRA